MGARTIVSGFIEEAWAGGEFPLARVRAENEQHIASLPDEDAWPPLCRSLFAFSSTARGTLAYRNRIIHMGQSLKGLEEEWDEWRTKLEALLRRMYWESAYVRLETADAGPREYFWEPTREASARLFSGSPQPVTEWTYSESSGAEGQ